MNKIDYNKELEGAGYKMETDSDGKEFYTMKIDSEDYKIEQRGNFEDPSFFMRALRNVDKFVEEITR